MAVWTREGPCHEAVSRGRRHQGSPQHVLRFAAHWTLRQMLQAPVMIQKNRVSAHSALFWKSLGGSPRRRSSFPQVKARLRTTISNSRRISRIGF